MATTLDTEEGARRLARAILNDIALYNEDRILASSDVGEDLAEMIGEGRTLFLNRVAEPLANVFEQELAEWTAKMTARADRVPRRATYQPTMEREVVRGEPEGRGNRGATIAGVVAVVVVIAGAVGYFLMR